MALVKFNRTAKKAEAIGSSKDADTLYFPTDEQSIYLNGKRVGGDSVSHAAKADYATNAGHATNADNATNAGHAAEADHATNADNATNAVNATNAGTAGKVENSLTLQLNNGSAKTFNGSASVTFNVTPSGIGAAPTIHDHDSTYSKLGHTHDIKNITSAGEAAKKGVDTYISNSPSSNLPTSKAVKDYIDKEIKNYTSAFRYAGNLTKKSDNTWQINGIPSSIADVDSMDFGTFEGGSIDDTLLQTGFTFYVMSEGTFDGVQVESGDMITCVGLYDGEERWEPSYHIVNGNITVTERVDNSTKVPTAGAVKTAISSAVSSAVSGLDGTAIADTNYVLTGVTETDGKISRHSQVAVDQTYSYTSSNPASGKSIAAAIATLDSTKSASNGYAITGITQENGVIKSITQAAFNNYSHPAGSAPSKTGVPAADATPGFGGKFKVNQITTDATSHVSSVTERTITIPSTVASTSNNGLMTAAQVGDLNKAKTDIAALLDALNWK